MDRPGGPVPDLDVVVDADDGHVLLDPGMLEQLGRHKHPALAVELGHGRSGEHVSLHLPGLAVERVELCDPGHVRVPRLARVHVDVPLDPASQNDTSGERMAKPGRQRDPVLLVDRVLVLAVEHGGQ
jgi:hypothetical protein